MKTHSDYQLILNCLPIRSGGGLQKTLSLLTAITERTDALPRLEVIAVEDSRVMEFCNDNGLSTIRAHKSNLGRLRFETARLNKDPDSTVMFNIGGPTMLRAASNLINVSECAYSNLFYPEIDFWSDRKGLSRKKSDWIDHYRRWSLKQADFWIFQTSAVHERALELAGFPSDRCRVVTISPSALINPNLLDATAVARFTDRYSSRYQFLFLGSTNENKRLHLLPKIARHLVDQGFDDFEFLLTLKENDSYAKHVLQLISEECVDAQFVNIGLVQQADVGSLISTVDCVCNFSRLESFSNNFVEAWTMQRPLAVTDADWARASCGQAAVYVDPEDIASVAAQIRDLVSEPAKSSELVTLGQLQLSKYSTPAEKLSDYLATFERAFQLGKMPKQNRRQINWPRIRGASSLPQGTS